jgi:hypothetical protein
MLAYNTTAAANTEDSAWTALSRHAVCQCYVSAQFSARIVPLKASSSVLGNMQCEFALALSRCSQSVVCAYSYSLIYAIADLTTAAAVALVLPANSALSML